MNRYTDLLEHSYRVLGHETRVLRPPSVLSSVGPARVKKYLVYIEKLVSMPVAVAIANRRADLVHVADHSNSPWLWAVDKRTRRVITCHDLIALRAAHHELPEHSTRATGRVYQHIISRGLRAADLLCCVSRTTLEDAARLLPGVESLVLYNPIFPAVAAPAVEAESKRASPYLLVVSNGGWRKRRWAALRCWALICAATLTDRPTLTLVGPPLTEAEVRAAQIPRGEMHRITTRANVSESELADLYAGATALVQTSKYEGFGWPIVEANARGVPALCADEPIFREVGLGAVFVTAFDDTVNWKDVYGALRDPSARATALDNAARFTMDNYLRGLAGAMVHRSSDSQMSVS